MERGYPLILLGLGTLWLPILHVRRVQLPPFSYTPLERRFLPDSSAKPPHSPLSLSPLLVREVGVGGQMGCLFQNTPPWALTSLSLHSPSVWLLVIQPPIRDPRAGDTAWWAVFRQQNQRTSKLRQAKMECGCRGPAGRDESCSVEAGGVQRGGIAVVGDPSTPGHHVVCLRGQMTFCPGIRVAGHGS